MNQVLPRRAALFAVGAALACMLAAAVTARVKLGYDSGQAALDWPGNYLVQAGVRWDSGWYERIAREGYWYRPGEQSPVAFFPVYPLVIRGLAALGADRWLAGEVLGLLSGVLGVVLFTRWARALADERTALLATGLIVLYPFAFYLYGVMYSDALFFALVVGAFLALEQRRVGLATLLGAVATATRPVAPAVVLGLLARNLELRLRAGERLRPRDVVPALAGAGLAAYMGFLWWRFGDPLAFAHAQAAPGWDHVPGPHTWFKLTWFDLMLHTRSQWVRIRLGGHALCTVGALVLALPTRKRLGWAYALYILVVMGIPAVSSKDLQGLGRYGLAAFPCFLTLALLLRDRPLLKWGWVAASGGLLLFLAAAFGATAYVA